MTPVRRAARPEREEPVLFDAVLYPHRSLSPKGFWILMTAVSLVSFAAGVAFLAAGAWPVFGFFGIDVLLLAWCFRLNYRNARLHETVHLTPSVLTVRRVLPSGTARSWSFQPFWLRVEMDDPPRSGSQLTIFSHGKRLIIGSFLTPDEKRELADALSQALRQARMPQPAAAI